VPLIFDKLEKCENQHVEIDKYLTISKMNTFYKRKFS